jgi:hypothetical protein
MIRTSAVDYVARLGLAGSGGRVGGFCIGHIEGILGCIGVEVVTGALVFEREDQDGRIQDGGASGYKAIPR